MRILCRTTFDITATGVTGHYKSSRIPFLDRVGQKIINEDTWNCARNQQRNYETILQLLGLRTQLIDIKEPEKKNDHWEFEFSVENPQVFGNEALDILTNDCTDVPMLSDNNTVSAQLMPGTNIWFEIMPVNIQ